MLIQWDKGLEIGDPIVDSEHRYLAQLINNLHEQFEAGKSEINLAKIFTHLVQYVRVHFENEEALMKVIKYPGLNEHLLKHKELIAQVMELADQYMEGEERITLTTLDFLKNWVVAHIAGTDMKIKEFLKGERPPSLTATPAFAAHSGPEFKVCTLCGKSWHNFDELRNDKDKVLKGVQLDLTNHMYSIILFNCSCDNTLAMFIKEFVTQTDIPFEIEEHDGTGQRPSYCLEAKEAAPCHQKCVCRYTMKILEALE